LRQTERAARHPHGLRERADDPCARAGARTESAQAQGRLQAAVRHADLPVHAEPALEKALQLLHTGDYSVREVADAVGYSYSKNFTTAFKRRYGVSPKIVRKSLSRKPKPRTGGT
jgi:hypothetical protein